MARLALTLVLLAATPASAPDPVSEHRAVGPSASNPRSTGKTEHRLRTSAFYPFGAEKESLRSSARRASRDEQRAPLYDWTDVAQCESGGDPTTDTGNGYYGLLQESLSFWSSFGGLRFAARPDLATEAEQITVAERGLAVQGIGAWPVCGRYIRTAS